VAACCFCFVFLFFFFLGGGVASIWHCNKSSALETNQLGGNLGLNSNINVSSILGFREILKM